MPEFALPMTARDRGRLDLRARLARAAREMRGSAVSHEAVDGAALLAIAGDLASLAIGMPAGSEAGPSTGPVDASTLFATQLLQHCSPEPGHGD